jgi:hypothetical protein
MRQAMLGLGRVRQMYSAVHIQEQQQELVLHRAKLRL